MSSFKCNYCAWRTWGTDCEGNEHPKTTCFRVNQTTEEIMAFNLIGHFFDEDCSRDRALRFADFLRRY